MQFMGLSRICASLTALLLASAPYDCATAQPVTLAGNQSLMTYLVECALPEGASTFANSGGTRMTFHGSLGLASRWAEHPLTPSEQRWVTACLLARSNLLGHKVEVSMRAPDPAPAALTSTASERTQFPLFEGGFYGNLFAEEPTAFVCGPARNRTDVPATARILQQDRLCTLLQEGRQPGKPARTQCGMVHTGPCGGTDGRAPPYGAPAEIVFVYLRP